MSNPKEQRTQESTLSTEMSQWIESLEQAIERMQRERSNPIMQSNYRLLKIYHLKHKF